MESQPPPRSFWCFISYRHADNKQPGRQWATWLHQQIETYEVPSDLVGTVNGRGDTLPERIFPVFRDEDELPADADLSSPIYRALDASKFLVVLCSPRAVQSTYVADEIAYYKKIGRSDRVLAAVLDGIPGECFPKPLRHPVTAEGVILEDQHAEPIAADFRLADDTEGWTSPEAYRLALAGDGVKDRKEIERRVSDYKARLELGKLKIIAGVLGLPLGTLTQRDKVYQLQKEQRRARIFRRVAAGMAVLLVAAVVGGVFAVVKKQEAEAQRKEAMAARDAEAAQRSLAETRRVEADEARGVAETRRTEAEDAKTLAEKRRVESETRLARSNVLLADRLTREGNTPDAVESLWEVPEQERQWEWGYLLGRAYPEASRVSVRAQEGPVFEQDGALDATGRRAAFWNRPELGGNPVVGDLKWVRIEDDGSVKTGRVAMATGALGAAWSRDGLVAVLDGGELKVISAAGKELGTQNVVGTDGEEPGPVAFCGTKHDRVIVKSGELWRLFQVNESGLSELSRIQETFEQESYVTVSPDGGQWIALSSDTGATLYDQDGKVIDQFPGVWHARAAFSDNGMLAVGSITEAVVLRKADGKHTELAEDGDVIVRNSNGITLQWVGKRLFQRSIRKIRSWNLGAAPNTDGESQNEVWEFPENEVTDTMVVNKTWLTVSLADGAILVSKADDLHEVDRLQGHQGLVIAQAFAFEDCLATVGEDGTLRHWLLRAPVRGGSTLGRIDDPIFKGHEDEWQKLTKSTDHLAAAAASPGRPTGTLVRITSPDGRRSASTGTDGQLRLWKGTGAEALLALPGPADHGESLAFSRDGRRIGGEFMQPGQDWSYECEWTTEPWTRTMLGIDDKVDWRESYEKSLVARFREQWVKRRAAGK